METWQEALKLARVYALGKDLLRDDAVIQHLETELTNFFSVWLEPKPENLSLSELRKRLRQLISEEAPWHEIEAIAFFLFDQHPSEESATRLLEYSFLFGELKDCVQVLEKVASHRVQFYSHVHLAVRIRLMQSLWNSEHDIWALAPLLQEHEAIAPEEIFYVFLYLYEKEEPRRAYFYYRRFARAIAEGQQKIGEAFKLSASRLAYMAADLAAKLSRLEEAAELAQGVHPGTEEYQAALNLIISSSKKIEGFERSEIYREWQNQTDWQARLAMLESILKTSKSSGEILTAAEINFNLLCEDLLAYFPKEPEIWSKVAALVVDYLDLAHKLPKLLNLFSHRVAVLEPVTIANAIWEPFLVDRRHPLCKRWGYFVAVAHLQRFLSEAPDVNLYRLWIGREVITQNTDHGEGSLSWNQLLAWAEQQIANLPRVNEKAAEKMLAALRVAVENPAVVDIEKALELKIKRPVAASQCFLKNLRKVHADEFELKLLASQVDSEPFTNEDLQRLWFLATKHDKVDQAWRVATILRMRQVLDVKIEQAWRICGENRKAYPYRVCEGIDIDACLQGFSSPEVQFIWGLLKLSTHLVDLLALNDSTIKLKRKFPVRLRLREIDPLETCFEQSKWFGPMHRDYEMQNDRFDSQIQFAHVMTTGNWAQVLMRLCHRLVIRVFKWDITHLRQELSTYRIQARGDKTKGSINRWLNSLSIEQKNAWYDFISLIDKIDAQSGIEALEKFVVRLSTVIYPHHDLALHSLIKMKAPLWLIRDLEGFILSEPYARLREEKGLAHQVNIPRFLLP